MMKGATHNDESSQQRWERHNDEGTTKTEWNSNTPVQIDIHIVHVVIIIPKQFQESVPKQYKKPIIPQKIRGVSSSENNSEAPK